MYVVNLCYNQHPAVIRGISEAIQVNPNFAILNYLTMVLGGGVTVHTATPLGLALGPQVGGPSVGTSPQNADRRPRSRDSNTHTYTRMHVALPRRRRYACTHISHLEVA